MEPVPYEVREEDVDEVLGAYGVSDMREEAVRHVMRHVRDIDEIVRSAPETSTEFDALHRDTVEPISTRAGDQSADRREMALAAIEDLLISGGYLASSTDARVFPVIRE